MTGGESERPDLPPEVEALEVVETALEGGGRLRRATALGIVLVSILAALMAWRASVADEASDATRVHAEQNRLAQQQLTAGDETAVFHDLQLFDRYGEHANLAHTLAADARRAPPRSARALLVRAQGERDAAASQVPLFEGVVPGTRRDGTARFDAGYARSQRRLRDVELLDLEPPDKLQAHAESQHERGVRLTGLAALFVAALVLLTFAELTRAALARIFVVSGAAVAILAIVLFIGV
jgi:hypothetical protein